MELTILIINATKSVLLASAKTLIALQEEPVYCFCLCREIVGSSRSFVGRNFIIAKSRPN